jgi:hypothetical protein
MTADHCPTYGAPPRPLSNSAALMRRAELPTPGGVNTARRKDRPGVLCRPRTGRVEDVDGNEYIAISDSRYDAIFHGHCHPYINERGHKTNSQDGAVRDRDDRSGGRALLLGSFETAHTLSIRRRSSPVAGGGCRSP